MRFLGGGAVILAAALMQVSWFGHVRPFGVIPNLVLIAVVLIALWYSATAALAAALGGGFLLDTASGSDFGLRMGFFGVVALAIVAGRQLGLNAGSAITGLVSVAVATVLYNLAALIVLGAGPSLIVLGRVGTELICNLIITAVIFIIRANIGTKAHTPLEPGGLR